MLPLPDLGQLFSALLVNPLTVPTLTAITAIATLAAAIAAAFSAHGAESAALVMRRDMELRQRPYVFVDRTEPRMLGFMQNVPIIKTGFNSRFYLRNGGARAARVTLRTVYSLAADTASGARPAEVLHEQTSELVVFAGQEMYVERVFEGAQLNRIEQGVMSLHVRADYSAIDHGGRAQPKYFSDVTLRLAIAPGGLDCQYRFAAADAN